MLTTNDTLWLQISTFLSSLLSSEMNLTTESNDTSEKTFRFKDQTIVITGAGGNFGREGCLFFAQSGAKVAALEVNSEALKETKEYVLQHYQSANILTFECNVTSVESVQAAMDQVIQTFGSIDMLWNNAGYQGDIKPTLEYDPTDFSRVMEINVTGMFIVLQATAKHMAKQQTGGSIVNTASVAGLRGTPAMVAYVSSKAAVLGMTGKCVIENLEFIDLTV
jgi:NAD(P)-dependent dehydrogenase (short-subunit alcohol dehydrogenase family)